MRVINTVNKNADLIKGIFLLLLAAILYSIMPVLIRLLGSGGIPPVSQVFLRYIFAFIAALFYYFFTSGVRIKIQKKSLPLLLFAALFGYGLTNLFFTISILNTQISNALFLFYSYAIIAPVLGFVILKNRVNAFNILSLILSFIAIALLFQPNGFNTWKIGGFFAILSALGQASYLISRKKLSYYKANFMMLSNTFIGVIFLGMLSLIIENTFYFHGAITNLSGNTWLATVIFGIDNFFAWLAMTKGFEYFKATSASVILLSELVFGAFFAFILFKESPTYVTIIGGILILFSSTLVILKGEK